MYYAIKILISALVVVAVSELAKRSTFWGALLGSLPITSLLAFVWLYTDTKDAVLVGNLAQDIFWLVLASLPLFALLPALLRAGIAFWPALAGACLVTAGAYAGLVAALRTLGVRL